MASLLAAQAAAEGWRKFKNGFTPDWGVALFFLFLIAVFVVIGLAVTVAVYQGQLRDTSFKPVAGSNYTIQHANSLKFLANCSNCYDAPTDCATVGGASLVAAETKIKVTQSATIGGKALLLQDTTNSKYFFLSGVNGNVCSGGLQSNSLSDWYFDVWETLSQDSAVVAISNGNSGKYLVPCSTNCSGLKNPSPNTGVFCTADFNTAVSQGLGLWVVRLTP
jgi:hypothetical protein